MAALRVIFIVQNICVMAVRLWCVEKEGRRVSQKSLRFSIWPMVLLSSGHQHPPAGWGILKVYCHQWLGLEDISSP